MKNDSNLDFGRVLYDTACTVGVLFVHCEDSSVIFGAICHQLLLNEDSAAKGTFLTRKQNGKKGF